MYFPPEIISAFLCFQSNIELKKARFVCKAFDAAAVPFLFDEIYVIARYADMERATLLASRFGPFVKTLIFCSEYFYAGVTREMFKCKTADRDLAERYYASYRKLQEEQEQLLNEGEFFGHLCSTLAVLSNLRKVILTNVCRTQGLCWCDQAYVDGHSRTFDPWSDEDHPAMKSLRPAPEHSCFESADGLGRVRSNAWPEVLNALFISGNTKIKAIVTEPGNKNSGLAVRVFCMTPRQRFCAAKVLPNLTSLHLHLDWYPNVYSGFHDDATHEELYSGRLIARTLSAAINLESLVIEMDGKDWILGEDEDFEMILGGCKMPKLVTFGLSGFNITETRLINFLQNSQGIHHMSLEHVRMVSGSWENVFQSIKDTLSLESLVIMSLRGGNAKLFKARYYGCHLHEAGLSIEKFLLGDGPNPFSKAALEDTATRNDSN